MLAACAAGLCLAAVAVKGQQKALEDAPTVFRTDTRVVVCNTTVVDKNGHLVTDLTRDNFSVSENGVAQKISSFKHEDVPVSLGLIIDLSLIHI